MPDPSGDLLPLARLAADAAAEFLLTQRPVSLTVATKSSPTDVVTQMDRAAESLIRQIISEQRPDDSIWGEEAGEGTGASEVRWIVDPLDGTVNYLYGLPLWSVSIAAEVRGAVAVGVVSAPALSLRYEAVRGHGATCVDRTTMISRPMRVSSIADLSQALIATGFGYRSEQREQQARIVATLLPQVRDIRRLGSAALDLCLVADGRVDAYYESGLHAWDVAAGALIATEAGAIVRGGTTDPATDALTLASAPGIAASLSAVVVAAGEGGA